MNHKIKFLKSKNSHVEGLSRRGSRKLERKKARRRGSSIFVMVDLLSCAFGSALFLFMISATPIVQVEASTESMSNLAYLTITFNSSSIRPIIIARILSEEDDGKEKRSFVIDAAHIPLGQGLREIEGASSNWKDGRVLVLGTTPWDVDIGASLPSLQLLFEEPASNWCFLYGVASDDTNARRRSIDDMKAVTIETDVLPALSSETLSLDKVNIQKGIGFASTCLPIKLTR